MTFTQQNPSRRSRQTAGRPEFRAVLFDLDGTLYRQRPMRALMALELATMPLSGPFSVPRRLRVLRAFRAAQERLRAGGGGRPASDQVAVAAEASGVAVAEVKEVVDEWMMRRPLKHLRFCRMPGLEAALDGLERAGLRRGVLSDYPAEGKLSALGLDGRFSPVLSASDPEIDAFKPSPRGYLRACAIWNLDPAEVLYVGDRADVDAAGAAAAGMPCAIVGRATASPPGLPPFMALSSFERLPDVLGTR